MTRGSTTILVQQSAVIAPRGEIPPIPSPWEWWSLDDLSSILQCPWPDTLDNWPIVYAALLEWGIEDYDVCRMVLATIAIETAHTFRPVQEAYWLSEAYRNTLRYAPYWGRGYIQLTWESNYRYYGWRIGHPELVDFPTKAMLPDIAAQVLAAYIVDKGVHLAARHHDWAECRRLVQGAYAGLPELQSIVAQLDVAAKG